ncbi:MAG: hypothetical protein WA968_11870 [Castellaniella sp.]
MSNILKRSPRLNFASVVGLLGGVIGMLGGVLAVVVGQWMSAKADIDEVIRPKLEDAYAQTLVLSSLAEDFQSAALSEITHSNFSLAAARYEQARSNYIAGVNHVVAIGDLYENDIIPAAQEVAKCAKTFVSVVADQFLLEAKLGGANVLLSDSHQALDPQELLKESLVPAVVLRDSCEKKISTLKKSIIKSMKSRL